MAQNLFNDLIIVNESDELHLKTTARTIHGVYLPDFLDQLAPLLTQSLVSLSRGLYFIVEAFDGTPERVRTSNLLLRRETIYPIDLRAHQSDVGYHTLCF